MIRVSRLADYGTVILGHMAGHPERLFSANDIAEEIRLNLPTVSKLLKSLAKAELVCSYRGSQGGYRLAKPAAQISIADVIDALDGRIALTECDGPDGQCELEVHCNIRGNWQRVGEVIRVALAGVSIAELINGVNEKVSA